MATLPINELKRAPTFGGCADLNLHRCKFWWLEALPSVKSTDCLTFSSFLEEVKDEIQNSLGHCCLYIQHFPKFIMINIYKYKPIICPI